MTSFQFDVTTDDAVTFLGIDQGGTISAPFTALANTNTDSDAFGRVGAFGAQALEGAGTLINLQLRLESAGSSSITLENFRLNSGDPAVTPETPSTSVSIAAQALSLPNVTLLEGETARIALTTDNLDDSEVLSFSFEIGYDPAIISIGDLVTDGTLSASFTADKNDVADDTVRVGAFGSTPIDDPDDAAQATLIIFEVTALAPGTSSLDLASLSLNAGAISVSALNGSVTVAGPANYGANLAGYNEVPPVMTPATGSVSAVLDGTTLTLGGSFDGLTGTLINIAGTPAHIHAGGVGTNGGVVIPLVVDADADSMGGRFLSSENTYELTSEQVEALVAGDWYVNIHTTAFNAGEIRGQLLAQPNSAPTAAAITAPADGAELTIEGDPSQPFAATWTESTDPEGNAIAYVWQLAADEAFETVVFETNVGDATTFETDFATVASLLEGAGVAVGETITLYHRANATDGSLRAPGESASVVLTLGESITETAMAQVIHNAPDAGEVDVYLNGELTLDDFGYMTATPYVEIPAGDVTIAITAGDAEDDSEPIFETTAAVPADAELVLVATATDEDAFSLEVLNGQMTAEEGQVAFQIFHGAEAPGVDIFVQGRDPSHERLITLASGLVYPMSTDYIAVDPAVYNVEVAAAGSEDALAVYEFDLSGLAGGTAVIVAGGDLAETTFFVTAYLADGTKVDPRVVTSNDPDDAGELPSELTLDGNYPNPFNPSTNIQFDLPQAAEVTVEVVDILGRTVMELTPGVLQAGNNRSVELSGATLASGMYIYRIIAQPAGGAAMTVTGRMTLIK